MSESAVYVENELYSKWKSSSETSRELIMPYLAAALQKHALSVCWQQIPAFPGEHEWVAQESVWRAVKSIEKFKGTAKFGTWFHRIALNECARLLKLKLKNKNEVPLEETHLPHSTGIEAKTDVGIIFSSLSGDDQILMQGKLEGLTFDEIGELLNIPAGTARARWFRLKAGLK
jgi:RNA polymerase sigma-70 factor (ECF subfamily)